jgi:hypothetical protein
MLDIAQLRVYVIRPVLQYLNLWSDVAENLVTGTAIQESRATYIKQQGNGPAVGLFQMEPVTHDDCWNNYIKYHGDLADKLRGLMITNTSTPKPWIGAVPANEMAGNLYYATAMCRVKYLRMPAALPANNIAAIGAYWKQWYNTPQGAGTADEFIQNYTTYNKYPS